MVYCCCVFQGRSTSAGFHCPWKEHKCSTYFRKTTVGEALVNTMHVDKMWNVWFALNPAGKVNICTGVSIKRQNVLFHKTKKNACRLTVIPKWIPIISVHSLLCVSVSGPEKNVFKEMHTNTRKQKTTVREQHRNLQKQISSLCPCWVALLQWN